LAGLRVLELSAGCGLPGMAAAAAGAAETVLTEVDEVWQ
jgi:predicted nicotinamide N-methyase